MNVSWLIATIQLALVVIAATLLTLDSDAAHGQPRAPCGYYMNSAGNSVPRPCNWTSKPTPPASGATARCGDGYYSYSRHPEDTCSDHGGVVRFFP
jgi:hypothetical protein